MTDYLVKHFVKNSENIHDSNVRLAYGVLSGVTGIICNIFLFILKFIIGTSVKSISIISDSFNNLSDSLSSVITLLGYKVASKPADEEHPFGHGRMEYIASFIVSNIIFVVAFELLTSSVDKIIHPEELKFSWLSLGILSASILVKIWLSAFNLKLGKRIDNIGMIAVSDDARNDVLVTFSTIVALFLSKLNPNIPFDGITGVIVSLVIFYSSFGIVKEIIGKLLGNPISREEAENIEKLLLEYPEIVGVHDLMVHDYGPGRQFASAHAEVDANMDFLKAHDVIDEAERKIYEDTGILMTLHLDPIKLNDPEVKAYQDEVNTIIKKIDPALSTHDFRIVAGPSHTNLVFDILVPYTCKIPTSTIEKTIKEALKHHKKPIYLVITFDHQFISTQEDTHA